MHLTFATHYCGGKVAASKISFSGELASCGMEGTEDSCPINGEHLKSHCCDDEVSVYSIENTFTPSFSFLNDSSPITIHVFAFPFRENLHSFLSESALLTSVCPPGECFTSIVSMTEICVFRI